tara:strand:- start:1703 stop:2365 length:663 start_codon:yes stop_codon:yes gene_type:complete
MFIKNIKHKDIFLDGEGDNWFLRNKKKLNNPLKDSKIINIVQNIIFNNEKKKINFLEIGCSNSSLLLNLKKQFKNIEIFGIDPSKKAINKLKKKGIKSYVATADNLQFKNKSIDIIFYGFCLYLCDQKDYKKILSNADRVLKSKGSIIILDFYSKKIKKIIYKHDKRVSCIKRDFTKIFTAKKFKLIYRSYFNYSDMYETDKYNEHDLMNIAVLKRGKNV